MFDPLTPQPRQVRPPGNLSNLQSRITKYARETGLTVSRLNQRVFTEVMFGLLARARGLAVIPMYLVKGGMALELRFGVRARASGDLDLGIVASDAVLIEVFDRVLAVGFDEFTFERRGEPERLENIATYRLKVKIAYRGRAFGTLDIDLNEASYETAVTMEQTGVLTALGLPGPLTVPLLDPYLQLAHKLHGATEPDRTGYVNRRHRDLLDILVMRSDPRLALDLTHLRTVVIEEFSRRPHHTSWPPIFAMRDAWREELARDARLIEFATSDPDELAQRLHTFIAEIEAVALKQEPLAGL